MRKGLINHTGAWETSPFVLTTVASMAPKMAVTLTAAGFKGGALIQPSNLTKLGINTLDTWIFHCYH